LYSRYKLKPLGKELVLILIFLLYRKITTVGKISLFLWIGVFGTILWLIIGGATHFNPKLAFDFPKGAFSFSWLFFAGLGSATVKTIYTYLGYYNVCHLGAEIKEISLPFAKYAGPAYYVITPSEISSNLARFDGIKYGLSVGQAESLFSVYAKSRGQGFGKEVKRRIMLGTYALSAGYRDAYYLQAQKVRTKIKEEMDTVLNEVDVILTPTQPTTAYKIGEYSNNPLQMYLEDIFVIPASLAGLPALAIPCGFSNGLPIGLQLIGKRFDESKLFNVGYQYQENTDWHKQRPEIK